MISTYIICYDIENNRWRKKLSDKLIAFGLERIQYSVFGGPLSEALLFRLEEWIQQNSENLLHKGNSVIVLDILPTQLEKMTIFGEVDFDPKMIAGKQNTLIL